MQGGAGNVLDTFHQLDQPIVVLWTNRGETDPAVPHYHGCDAMP